MSSHQSFGHWVCWRVGGIEIRGWCTPRQCVRCNYFPTSDFRTQRAWLPRGSVMCFFFFFFFCDQLTYCRDGRGLDYWQGLFLLHSLAQREKHNDYNASIILKGPLLIALPCLPTLDAPWVHNCPTFKWISVPPEPIMWTNKSQRTAVIWPLTYNPTEDVGSTVAGGFVDNITN